jgi:hypothetical protein
MYQPYEDIRQLSEIEPLWHDENGVPRYVSFKPRLCADIYATFVALLEIKCQGCGFPFVVSSSWTLRLDSAEWDKDGKNPKPKAGLPTSEDSGYFDYGDAPWHTNPKGHQCSGTTMTTDVSAVLQFWRQDKDHDWIRDAEHEFRYELPGEP